MFNRDEPDREKLVFVTVKASDQGRPPLEDVCTIKVKIKVGVAALAEHCKLCKLPSELV